MSGGAGAPRAWQASRRAARTDSAVRTSPSTMSLPPSVPARRSSSAAALIPASAAACARRMPASSSADWQLTAPTIPFANFTAVAWSDSSALPGSAWAVGKRPDSSLPVAMYSNDGGNSWTDQALPGPAPLSGNSLEDVFFLDDLRGWAVGTQGLILHTATGGR